MNCTGCGTVLDPTEEQVNSAVDQVLEVSLKDAHKTGGVCPLCGHSKEIPFLLRKTVQFALLMVCLVVGVSLWFHTRSLQQTRRSAAAADAIDHMSANPDVIGLIGKPIAIEPGLQGEVKEDETGWQEARLTIPVHGPQGKAIVRVAAGRLSGPWDFTTFEVIVANQHKKVDLVAGRVVAYDTDAYVDVHMLPVAAPEFFNLPAPAPVMTGEFPCVFATVEISGVVPQIGSCPMPTMQAGPVDRFEADLRYGRFVLRETDLYLDDGFKVPLTRTYDSDDWISRNHVHAFGSNANHPFDIAPIGSRDPYTFQMIVLEDGDFLYFDRISKGSGYTNAVYRHAETSTGFYKALHRWNGSGWTTQLTDGSEILFPESYNAKNLAQGAPIEMRNAKGDRLELHRDGSRNLEQITTPHGHWIRFRYDGLSRITQAEDDAGHWAHYEYNADSTLSSVVLSTGRERHYQYDGLKMTAITDEKGRTLLRNWYIYGELIRQQFGNGEVYSYRYSRSSNRRYVEQALITLPDQSTQDVNPANFVPGYVKQMQ